MMLDFDIFRTIMTEVRIKRTVWGAGEIAQWVKSLLCLWQAWVQSEPQYSQECTLICEYSARSNLLNITRCGPQTKTKSLIWFLIAWNTKSWITNFKVWKYNIVMLTLKRLLPSTLGIFKWKKKFFFLFMGHTRQYSDLTPGSVFSMASGHYMWYRSYMRYKASVLTLGVGFTETMVEGSTHFLFFILLKYCDLQSYS